MKPSLLAGIVLAMSVTLATVSAQEKPFAFKIEGKTLHVFAPDGKEVGSGIPTATVGQTVSAPPYSFQVSFGTDASGSPSVIVTPDPEHPAPLNFTLGGQEVHMDKGSVATVTVDSSGTAHVEGGLTGGVKVGSAAAPSTASGTTASNTPTGTAPAAPTAPTASGTTQQQDTPGVALTPLNNLPDPTAPSPLGPPTQSSFNSSQQAVAVNSPTTSAAPTTPF